MSARECTTQAEVDAAIAAGDVVVVRGGEFVLHDSARAYLHDSASARLHDSARAYLHDSASAVEGETGRPLRQSRPVILIGPIGSRNAMLSVYQCEDGGQLIRAGRHLGSRDEFAAVVAAKYSTGQYADEYRAALAMIDALKGAA